MGHRSSHVSSFAAGLKVRLGLSQLTTYGVVGSVGSALPLLARVSVAYLVLLLLLLGN